MTFDVMATRIREICQRGSEHVDMGEDDRLRRHSGADGPQVAWKPEG